MAGIQSGQLTSRETAIVVGGGVVGLACAHRLLRSGLSTTVIAPAAAAETASWGSAGHLAVEQAEPLASRKSMRRAVLDWCTGSGAVRLPLGEAHRWLPFLVRLTAASGSSRFSAGTAALRACMERAGPAWRTLLDEIARPELLLECGHFVVWESSRSAQKGKARWRSADTGPAYVRDATAGELEQLGSLVKRRISGAVRFESTGQFTDPGALLEALEKSLASAGGQRVIARAAGIGEQRGRAIVEADDGTRYEADAVVIAAGVDSGRLLAPTGLTAPIIAERGYHIQAPPSAYPPGFPPIVFEDRSLIVTNFTSGIRASGFVELAGTRRPPDETRWLALHRHVSELGLPFGGPVTRWMGARPTLPDYLPAIGRSPRLENLYYAFGHQHLGLTLAAVTGELVRDLVTGRLTAAEVRSFDLARFGGAAKRRNQEARAAS